MIRALAAAIVLAVSLTAAAQGEAPEADSREAHARAVEAVSRAQRLETRGQALPLQGETFAIQGLGLAVAGTAQDIGGLLRELNAEVRGKQVRIALAADVLFDFDKAELKAGAAPSLAKVAAVLKSYPKATARIEGHTDSKGERAYNQKLSERRAE
ncbi:MAG TPA: OmpA family protein, partial [Usitatibacter sp.]|nr:OmpA family protein [Usitatibacter sp.]